VSSPLLRWLRTFKPLPMKIDARERVRVVVGALLGITLAAALSHAFAGSLSPWLVAPMGASAVLVFGVPASPMAQPWSVVGGNTVSAFVGIACAAWIPDPHFAAGAAVAIAIGCMFLLGCLHPPGGASALLMVLTHTTDPRFALFPVLLNAIALSMAGVLYNSLTGRRYPHAPTTTAPAATPASRFSEADLDFALSRFNQVLNVSRDDLEQLLTFAEAAAYGRNLGELTCADVMSGDPIVVEYGTSLEDAWRILRQRRIKALPVVDPARHVIGIVTPADFMRHADLDRRDGIGQRLHALIRSSGASHSDKPEAVGQIMTRQVRVASASQKLTELMPLFSHEGHHHIPVIDDRQKLVGIITQSDLVRALYHAVRT
jgi:CBS domain-containing membrane protein